jgi:hypothetical protein
MVMMGFLQRPILAHHSLMVRGEVADPSEASANPQPISRPM